MGRVENIIFIKLEYKKELRKEKGKTITVEIITKHFLKNYIKETYKITKLSKLLVGLIQRKHM